MTRTLLQPATAAITSGKADKDGDGHGSHGGHGSIATKLGQQSETERKAGSVVASGYGPDRGLPLVSRTWASLWRRFTSPRNLGIPFDQLKAKMTGPPPLSLGKAITALDPSANAKMALKQAEKQAKADLHTGDGDHDGDKHDAASTPATAGSRRRPRCRR